MSVTSLFSFLHVIHCLIIASLYATFSDAYFPATVSSPKVLIAGATGRVGRLVVEELLQRRNESIIVKAVVRDKSKAKAILSECIKNYPGRLELVKADLGDKSAIRNLCSDADAVVWCASGFTDASSPLDKLKGLLQLKFFPKEVIDISALREIGISMREKNEHSAVSSGGPVVVVCSSAGVTRPSWTASKKARFLGASDIPIVRLNPLGILDTKREGEQALRDTGVKYAIVRPCGLNDKWPTGRPILSQGDLAVGRTSRPDVAGLLVDMLFEPNAAYKTFEAITVPGYPKPRSYNDQLGRLTIDSEPLSDEILEAQYGLLQQLLPGEILAPNLLAMGQTYEQLDKGEQGRLGARGKENAPITTA